MSLYDEAKSAWENERADIFTALYSEGPGGVGVVRGSLNERLGEVLNTGPVEGRDAFSLSDEELPGELSWHGRLVAKYSGVTFLFDHGKDELRAVGGCRWCGASVVLEPPVAGASSTEAKAALGRALEQGVAAGDHRCETSRT